ncbi:alpha/beta hydrolase domain-containing protein [Ornithinimicrobium cavernae]|uniref:alpha/beta hydrolase domain-containing protein n=1 Tax=Ornithinimicrobium cavernae TaxID=2666047 RepID=UPI000D689822|nr:alpha/beta hydrolase domain-containing protein [Ornithinimicrobium cavernae]
MSASHRATVATAVAALVLSAAPVTGAAADPGDALDELTAVPSVVHVPRTTDSYPFNAADHARVPVDLEGHGYVEEEFFLSGYANVYTKADGSLGVQRSEVPYTNRILVRRPAQEQRASGTVIVDIYNASNGYDIEDMWRRLYSTILENNHTYVGVTSKPINVDALYTFDPARYDDLTWQDEECERTPVDLEAPGGVWQVVPCTESGLAWDIFTQTGNALRDPVAGSQLLGGAEVRTMLLVGQSQSGMYLNTYVNHFHEAVTAANGHHVFDGYLTAAANWVERPISDAEFQNPALVDDGLGLAFLEGPQEPVDVDVPWLSVDTEGDALLFPKVALLPRELDGDARVWQVPGTSHTYSMSPVVPDNAELLRAGRPARVFPSVYTPYPGEPAMWAATQALVDAHQRDTALPDSRWFERDADGNLARDEAGNALGGVRYGLLESGVAEFLGAAAPGDMNGVANPVSLTEFGQRWNNRSQFLAEQRALDNRLRQQGYLTRDGHDLMAERAEVVLDRIGVR